MSNFSDIRESFDTKLEKLDARADAFHAALEGSETRSTSGSYATSRRRAGRSTRSRPISTSGRRFRTRVNRRSTL